MKLSDQEKARNNSEAMFYWLEYYSNRPMRRKILGGHPNRRRKGAYHVTKGWRKDE